MTLHFHSDQCEKTNKWAGNMLMFHVDLNMKRLGIRFKNDSFQWFRVKNLFWETRYTVHFQMWNFAGCFHSLIAVLRPIHTVQTNANKLVCWSLLDQCVTSVGVGWCWLEFVLTRLNMLKDIELVGVCWCSVNMTVIFQKILNPTANLSQLVCWSLLAFVCAVWIGLYTLHERSFSKIHNRGTLNCNIISQYSYFYSIFDQICTVFLIKYADAVLVSISDIFQKHKTSYWPQTFER